MSYRATIISIVLPLLLLATSAQARFLQTDPVGYQDDPNLYTYVGNNPTNATDPTGKDTFFVARPVATDSQAHAVALSAAVASERLVPGSGQAAYVAAFQQAKSFMHSFLVVTEGSTSLQTTKAPQVWSWGPSGFPDLGNTSFQNVGSSVLRNDKAALRAIGLGTAKTSGIVSSRISGEKFNAASTSIFDSLAKSGSAYSIVPELTPGEASNSNSPAFVGANAAAAAAGTTFAPPRAYYPGANAGWEINGSFITGQRCGGRTDPNCSK